MKERSSPPGSESGRGWGPALLPFLTALLLYLSFPDWDLWPLAGLGLGPLVFYAVRSAPKRVFWASWLAGVTLYVAAMPWVVEVMTRYGGLSSITAVGVMMLLHVYLGLYFGVYGWLLARTARRSTAAALLAAPLVWGGLEWVRSWIVTGFPWIPLGLTQWRNPGLLQHAEWGGIFVLSMMVALAGTGCAALALPGQRRLGAAMLVTVGLLQGTGEMRRGSWEQRLQNMPRPLAVGVVQADVPMEERWDSALQAEIEDRHYRMTEELFAQGAQAVIWSESSFSVPGGLWTNTTYRERLGRFVRRMGGTLLLGGTSREHRGDDILIYNSAFVISGSGELIGRYDKQHLVPFGEYVPLARLLFFAEKLVREVGDFGPGTGPNTLPFEGTRVGVPICYEIVFPGISRGFVRSGAELLATITNDAWFGRTAAPEQHFAQAVVRAVETRRFVLRSANTGISGLISPVGEVEVRSATFERAAFIGNVAPLRGITPYVRFGDVLPMLGLILAAVLAVRRGR